jgi:hypothetical protein
MSPLQEAIAAVLAHQWHGPAAQLAALERLVREAQRVCEQPEPVAWRAHVENRLRTWRQSTMNRCGDRLALDDFMGQDSIEDLIDYVCDEWAEPPAPQPPQPLTDEQITAIFMTYGTGRGDGFNAAARAIERAHGIKGEPGNA